MRWLDEVGQRGFRTCSSLLRKLKGGSEGSWCHPTSKYVGGKCYRIRILIFFLMVFTMRLSEQCCHYHINLHPISHKRTWILWLKIKISYVHVWWCLNNYSYVSLQLMCLVPVFQCFNPFQVIIIIIVVICFTENAFISHFEYAISLMVHCLPKELCLPDGLHVVLFRKLIQCFSLSTEKYAYIKDWICNIFM